MSTPGSSRRRTAAAYKKGFEAGELSALAKATDAPPTGIARTATGINLSFVAKALRTYADHVDGKPVSGDWFGCDLREAANMLEAGRPPVAYLRHGEAAPVLNVPFGAMWITDKDDPQGFPVYTASPAPSVAVKADEAAKLNPIVSTGRTRRRWLFWTQYEYEGPIYKARWQTPYNVDKWPRARYWLYQKPAPQPLRTNEAGKQ